MVDSIFAERRARVLAAMGPGVLVVFAAPAAIRNNDVEHEYRQDSDFYYLTGFDEPESVLALSTVHEKSFVLFVRPRDPEREAWDGRNFVKKAVNWALRQIGKRSRQLNEQAIQCALRIQRQGTTSARWIAADALRELRARRPPL